MTSYLFVAIVLLTLVGTNVIAFWKRGDGGFRVYAADPNNHSMLSIALSLIGTIVGGGMFLAVGQIGYEAGVVGYVFGLCTLAGLLLVASLASRLREAMDVARSDTLIDLLQVRFSGRVSVLFSFVNLAMYFFLLAGQFVAMYSFVAFTKTLTPHIHEALPWILFATGAISMLVYPIIGGLRKDIVTDKFQVGLIVFAAGALWYTFTSDKTGSAMWKTLPVEHMSATGYGIVFLLGVVLFVPGLFLVRMDVWQRVRAARNTGAAVLGLIIGGIAAAMFYFVFTSLGMWAFAENTASAEMATLSVIVMKIQSPALLGVVIGAFFAAILSSADTFINIISVSIGRVLWGDLWSQKNSAEDASVRLLRNARVFAVVAVLIAIVIAWIAGDFVDLLVGAFSLLLMFLPTILGTFVESWRCEAAAFYSSLLGVVIFTPLFFFWNPKLAFAPSVVLSVIVYGVVCRVITRNQEG